MSRDDLPYKTNVTKVTEPPGYSNSTTVAAGLSSSNETFTKPSFYTALSDTNHSTFTESPFYYTYNPETGINIASFLGGILVVLVIYVIYRTKCRKRILSAIQKCTMKYFPEDYPQLDSQGKGEQKVKPSDAEWISESAKMIWKERANLSRDSEASAQCFKDNASCVGDMQEQRLPRQHNLHVAAPCTNDCDSDCVINMYFPHLPDMEEDTEQATAQWVQNVKEMDVKERQLNGIILKIPPDLVSHNSKIRSHFNSVTEYGDLDESDSINISQQRHISLPCLIERRTRGNPNYANTHYNRTLTSYGYVPLASQENVDLECDYRPIESDDERDVGNRIPLDICPIVKIQHYHSRSKRRLTSLCRSSSDELSSSSSEEHQGSHVPSGKEAKYRRLQTEDKNHSQRQDKTVTFASTRQVVSPCRNKHSLLGNHTESVL